MLSAVTIPDTVGSIGQRAFSYCSSLPSITIPNSVDTIGDAFYCCYGLETVTLSNRLTRISERMFYACGSLTDITIPDSVTSIGEEAFYSCRNLSSVTIPESVTSIEMSAFSSCSKLSSITIPSSVTTISNYAFSRCNSLETVYYDGTAEQRDDVQISSGNDPLLTAHWVYMKNILTLPSSLTKIESEAFVGIPEVYGVRIPAGVTSIATDAIDHSVVIYAPAGSFAAEWAAANGYTLVEE